MKPKISACLVLFNEENRIRKCLESIKDLVDEIVVIHDGPCQDRTINICKEFGAKVFIGKYTGNPEYHRIELLKKAKNNWILQIDADEILSDELREEINRLAFDKDGYWIKILAKNSKFKKYHLRLYNKKKIKFIGLIHHEPELQESLNSQILKNPIYHYQNQKESPDKWTGIQTREYLKDFSEIPKYNWSEEDWSKNVKFRRDHPFLALFFAPLRSFFHFTKKYNLHIGLKQAKYSFLLGQKIIDLKYRNYLYLIKYKLVSFFLNGIRCFLRVFQKRRGNAYIALTFDDEIKKEQR